jgi:photosystem II stability/assembly factor-like uncharacterized protein
MTISRIHSGRLRGAAVAALAAVAAAVPLAQRAEAQPVPAPVPSKIAVPEGNKLFLVGHAVGVQIYSCKATDGGSAWAPAGPRADLYGDNGKLIATHYAGPTWRALDGSTAVGSVQEKETVDPTAIPWLRLSAKGTPGSDGARLAATTFIQRIATTGGLAPAPETCTADTAGAVKEVPYTADYTFWKAA